MEIFGKHSGNLVLTDIVSPVRAAPCESGTKSWCYQQFLYCVVNVCNYQIDRDVNNDAVEHAAYQGGCCRRFPKKKAPAVEIGKHLSYKLKMI